MDNPEKLATRRRKTNQKHNTICIGHHYAQTNTNNVNKTWALLHKLEVKTNWTSFLCGNSNGHHNMEPRTSSQKQVVLNIKNSILSSVWNLRALNNKRFYQGLSISAFFINYFQKFHPFKKKKSQFLYRYFSQCLNKEEFFLYKR